MSGNVFRHHKETYIMNFNNIHEVVNCSHMSSGEIKDGIEERQMEVILG
jgi:hypothetical protein